MVRRVAFAKAVMAGAAGALAWEAVFRPFLSIGIPLFDLPAALGGVAGLQGAPAWWAAGLAVHLMVGAIWAIFYAYLFWSTFDWRPAVQGLVFAIIPMLLAGLIMVPQIGLMHPMQINGRIVYPGIFAWRLGWGGPVGIVLGHAIFGLVMGAIYVRPVGYAVGRPPRIDHPRQPKRKRHHTSNGMEHEPSRFMFATGIECSYPTIDNGRWRMDELQLTDHYRYWRRDLELVRQLGLRYLRYGPPLHLIWRGPGKYDWEFMDDVARAMLELDIVPIMDLCHFGVPDWLGDFQNPEFPEHFARYAADFARRYDWVKLYTPINEMYVTARMSALEGVWNEQLRSERGFVTAIRHLTKATMRAMQEILRLRPDAVFINSESSEFFQPCCPDERIQKIARFENQRRFIALDLLHSHPADDDVRHYLFDNGMPPDEYDWFMHLDLRRHCILGLDYYEWNEKLIDTHGGPEALGEMFGWYVVAMDYWDRYRIPLMHTETNTQDANQAPGWLWRQWHSVRHMRDRGIPVLGFTWYGLTDQVDWNVGLTRAMGNVNPTGLFDLNRDPRIAALAYRQLIGMFRNEPLFPPSYKPAQHDLHEHRKRRGHKARSRHAETQP
jgi:beta-glucosidase/6-phospho-beta-glucosidase/beta-galactosidase